MPSKTAMDSNTQTGYTQVPTQPEYTQESVQPTQPAHEPSFTPGFIPSIHITYIWARPKL